MKHRVVAGLICSLWTAAAGGQVVHLSSASLTPNIAPDSLVTALGDHLAGATASGTAPYPLTLAGVTVKVTDSAGVARPAPLLYVSPSQINYLVPAGTAPGAATVRIEYLAADVQTDSAVQVQNLAPGLFTANEDGKGVAAATAYFTVLPTGPPSPIPVFQCDSGPGSCVSVPLRLGIDTPIFATFYVTGIRNRSSDAAVSVTIGGQAMPVRSITAMDDAGPLAGVDAIEIGVTLNLRNAGEVDVQIGADGAVSNAARINVQ